MATIKAMNETFKEFKFEDNLENAKILNMKLYKRKNTLVLDLESEEFVKLKSIAIFEAFVSERFRIEHTWINMHYGEVVKIPSIEDDWKNIMALLARKYPIARQLLANANLEVEGNKLNVYLTMKGADFLNARGLNVVLEKLIESLYMKKYKVIYTERISEETLKILEQRKKHLEDMALEQVASSINIEKIEENKVHKKQNNKTNENKTKEKETKQVPQNDYVPAPPPPMPEENTPLILGRNMNIREELVKVEDIGVDTGKLSLEGEVINTDSRELKSGKWLVMFDVYDGTSTITCKAFVPGERGAEVLKKIQSAKGVKIEGTAQFDPFAKELGVIANTIIETPGRKSRATYAYSNEPNGCNDICNRFNKKSYEMGNEIYCNYRPWSCTSLSRSTQTFR